MAQNIDPNVVQSFVQASNTLVGQINVAAADAERVPADDAALRQVRVAVGAVQGAAMALGMMPMTPAMPMPPTMPEPTAAPMPRAR